MTSTNTPAHTVIEYGLAERVAGELRTMPQCGSWFTDRYYAGDLTGRDAAEAALVRVAAQVAGAYEVVELRTFLRSHSAGLADALTDAELREYLRLRTAPGELDRWVEHFRGRTLSFVEAAYDAAHCEGDEPGECEGHESLAGADMGRTVFCDGTCR